MATSSVGKKALLLGLLVAALVATAFCATSGASAEASVTISNPATMVVNVLVGDKNVKVATDVMTVHLDHPEQDIQIQTAEGRATELHVQDGDVLVLYPDPDDYDHLSVQVFSDTPVTPSVTPMKPGIRSPPSPSVTPLKRRICSPPTPGVTLPPSPSVTPLEPGIRSPPSPSR